MIQSDGSDTYFVIVIAKAICLQPAECRVRVSKRIALEILLLDLIIG